MSTNEPHASRSPVALTIAGSDSGGGAGIQADLKTFEAFGVFGTTAITAVTAQNTKGVREALALPPGLVTAQIDAVLADLRPTAIKTGMLATAEIVEAVACRLSDESDAGGLPVVVDPVMLATSGDALLDDDAVALVRDSLLPIATVITPNAPEAERLTGLTVRDAAGLAAAARALVDAGASAALVKGGHADGDTVIDVLWDGASETVFEKTRLDSNHTHGTGCTLAAAIAAGLALGSTLAEATASAISYTREAIASAPGLGAGHGPLNHRAAGLTLRTEPRCS